MIEFCKLFNPTFNLLSPQKFLNLQKTITNKCDAIKQNQSELVNIDFEI